jgi:CheY-like chemotaxis protein
MIGNNSQLLLIVEDSDEDFEALNRVMQQNIVVNPIFRCIDGDEALDFLHHCGNYSNSETFPCPSIILLDLNLPGTDGREVIAQIKQHEHLRKIPIVVFTSSANPKDVEMCYQHSVASYILKPIDIEKLIKTIHSLITYWLDIVILPDPIHS